MRGMTETLRRDTTHNVGAIVAEGLKSRQRLSRMFRLLLLYTLYYRWFLRRHSVSCKFRPSRKRAEPRRRRSEGQPAAPQPAGSGRNTPAEAGGSADGCSDGAMIPRCVILSVIAPSIHAIGRPVSVGCGGSLALEEIAGTASSDRGKGHHTLVPRQPDSTIGPWRYANNLHARVQKEGGSPSEEACAERPSTPKYKTIQVPTTYSGIFCGELLQLCGLHRYDDTHSCDPDVHMQLRICQHHVAPGTTTVVQA